MKIVGGTELSEWATYGAVPECRWPAAPTSSCQPHPPTGLWFVSSAVKSWGLRLNLNRNSKPTTKFSRKSTLVRGSRVHHMLPFSADLDFCFRIFYWSNSCLQTRSNRLTIGSIPQVSILLWLIMYNNFDHYFQSEIYLQDHTCYT
jgi:hypothetical protein